jgi:hypothetical protein
VFKNRVLRKIYGRKRGMVIGEWRTIHNEELYILCSVDHASRYIYVIKTNLMHYLCSVYFINQPLSVLGIFVAHHQEGSIPNLANTQSTKKHNTYQLLYIYSVPPDDGLQICPKHVEVD